MVAFVWQVKTMQQPSISLPLDSLDFSSFPMASVLQTLLDFLRIVRLTKDYIPRLPRRWVSLLSALGRKFSVLWCFWLGKLGTLQRSKPPERPFFGRKTNACSVCDSSAISKGYAIAASTVPESANYPNIQERAVRQTTTAVGISPPTHVGGHSVDHAHAPNSQPLSNGMILAHRSSGTLGTISTQDTGSDRSSVITNSGEEIHAPVIPRGQFGRRPGPSRSRDRPSKPASLTNTLQPLHSEITDLHPRYHGDRRVSRMVQSSMSSHIHEPLSLPPMDENRRNLSSTSVVFNVQNPSTESPPRFSSTNSGQLTEVPGVIEIVTPYLSPVTAAADPHDEASIHSLATLDNLLPEGRDVQLINSDQVPRYTKGITMQVDYIVMLLHLLHLLADSVSRRRTM